ncbi:MAG TPA: cyclic 2,3-diphosphoglycerate synthase [Jiangellaceae bacterium]|nr:cyclic 2,3-diphosphoglycerate synthase [Jiangellaceae bacterium]
MTRRVLIMGAAGRDFHNFNTVYRDDPEVEVVAFTATQIPGIEDRTYPPALAGPQYPSGIAIRPEEELTRLIRDLNVDDVVFGYSDVSHEYVMHRASQALAAGANFVLLGPKATMLEAQVPVVSVCAVRTGAGKSQTTRKAAQILREAGHRPVVVRHPMPYGDLVAQRVQRFASGADLDAAGVTVEEREEYEHHIAAGTVVFAGVDYQAILDQAQQEADVVLWDGGNNDLPFFRPTVHLVVADPLRAGHETAYHPGEANLRMADVVVINKVDVAAADQVERVRASVKELNPTAVVIEAESPVSVDRPEQIRGRRVLVIEDGPTLTHGEMKFGAGVVAARREGAAEIIDPRSYATGSLRAILDQYDVGPVLPAEGYSPQQLAELEATITATDADVVVIATPIDLRHVIHITKPAVRVTYELREVEGSPTLADALAPVLQTPVPG